ncbi:MAG: PKD domain-containing protein [Candidatus Thermoplasmatota archaeon]
MSGTDSKRIGWQALAEVLPQGTTLGLLMDTDGLDRYAAGQRSQGIATDQADAPFRYAFCRNPAWLGTQQGNVSACAVPEDAEANDPILVGTERNEDYMETQPLGPALRGPLVGLLLDSDGTDQYDYADDRDGDALRKVPLGNATGPDDWAWRQEDLVRRTASDANAPAGFFQGPLDPVSTNNNREPVATLNLSSASAPVGAAVTFTLGAKDPENSTVGSRLDFGDGTFVQLLSPQGTSDGKVYTHAYAAPGNYRPVLRVFESSGELMLSGSTSQPLAITDGSTNRPPIASISVHANTEPATGQTGIARVTEFSLALDASDPDGDAITQYRLDWGDATGKVVGSSDPKGTAKVYTYQTPGHFIATLHVKDARGAWGSTGVELVVRRTPVDSSVPPVETLRALYNLTRDPPTLPGDLGGTEIPLPTFGGGIDASTFNAALRQLDASPAPVPRVSLTAWRDENRTVPATDGRVTGITYLNATVSGVDPALVNRLDITSERGVIGRADPVPGTPGSFGFAWATDAVVGDASTFSDGAYRLRAAAVVRADGGAPGRTLESKPLDLTVDNVPVLAMVGDRTEFSARSHLPAPKPLNLTLGVGADSQRPAGVPGNGTPGGYLEVKAALPGGPDVVLMPRTYQDAGPLHIVWDGHCGSTECDGAYTVRATLEDSGGKSVSANLQVRLDSTPPDTQVQVPRYVGTSLSNGAERIRVPWTASDSGVPLSGATVDLIVLDPSSGPHVVAANQSAAQGEAPFSPARHGMDLQFVTIGRDRLGNSESGCAVTAGGGEGVACIQSFVTDHPGRVRLTTIDFSPPEVTLVEVSRGHVRPGEPFQVNATVTESGTGLAAVTAFFTGDPTPRTMAQVSGTQWTYAGWGDVNGGFNASERTVAVRVEAVDLASNLDGLSETFLLDNVTPRLQVQPVRYFAPGGKLDEASELEVGRPDGVALVSVATVDASLEDGLPRIQVQVDPSPFNSTLAPIAMDFAPLDQAWVAEVHIPLGQADGTYVLPLRVVDAAGNLNVTAVSVLINSTKGRLANVAALATHESVTVSWESLRPATTQAAYGRSAISLNQATPVVTGPTTEHVVTIEGLAPNTLYFVQGVSRGGNGVENRTAVVPIRTRSAIELGLDGIRPDATHGGGLPVSVRVGLRTGEDAAVHVALSAVPENPGLRPVPLLDLGDVKGTVQATVDLRPLPDGPWRLQVEASRPGDQATLMSALFQVDNGAPFLIPVSPAPGAMVNASRPVIIVAVGDPGGTLARNWTVGARLLINGQDVAVVTTAGPLDSAQPGTASLLLVPAAPLPEGEHRIEVRAHDGAGNEARVAWPFTIDTLPPAVASVRATGPGGGSAAPPGGIVHVEARISDAGRVAAVYLDGGWLAQPHALREKGGLWQADVPVPALPDGSHAFRILAFDGAGNRGIAADAVAFAIDGTPPRLVEWTAEAGLVGARLSLSASEPVVAAAFAGSHLLASTEALLQRSALDVAGLRPGRTITLDVHLTDAAGLETTVEVSFETMPDQAAPGTPGAFTLSSEDEGVIDLQWTPASDNAGIDRYEVATGPNPTADDWRLLANGTATRATLDADAGKTLAVHVRAIDLAGLAGAATSGSVEVLALPHIEDARASSDVAKAGQRITFEAVYRHASGRPAQLTLRLGDRVIPMDGDGGDCRAGCRYIARVSLEATDLFEGPPMFTVEADDGLHQASSAPQPAPLVTSGDAGSGLTVPAVGPGLVLLLFAFAARRRRR